MKMIFLVDGDNDLSNGLNGVEMLSEEDTVLIFYSKGMQLANVKNRCSASKADIQFIESVKPGKNSVDFQIIAELGVLVGRKEVEYAYIISKDKGYEASITAMNKRYTGVFEEIALKNSIEECLKLTFMLRAKTKHELYTALGKEYGNAHGALIYNNLKQIFKSNADEPKIME